MKQHNIIAERILNDMTDGVITVDMQGKIITLNAAAERILGIRAEEVDSHGFGEIFLEMDGADEFCQAILDAVYESSVSHNRIVPFCNNGQQMALVLTTTFLKTTDADGGKLGVIGVFSDISELQKLQEAEARHAEELKIKHRELQDAYLKTEQGNQQLQAALKKVQVIRITATAFTIILFLGIGLYVWNRKPAAFTQRPSAPPTDQMTAKTSVTVTPQPVTSGIALAGKLQPLQMVNVTSPLTGKVAQIMVRYGDVVTAGQSLLGMDIGEARIKQREAEAAYIKAVANYRQIEKWTGGSEVTRANRSLAKAKMSLENQKKTLEETERLYKKGIIATTEYDSARHQYVNQQMDYQSAEDELKAAVDKGNPQNLKVARYEMDNAETRLKQIEKEIAAAVVVSPVSGIVMKPSGGGQTKDAKTVERGGSFQTGELMLAIGDLSGFSVACKLDEVDVTRVKNGQKVKVSGDAFPGEQMNGVIGSISSQAEDGDSSGRGSSSTFSVRVVIDSVSAEIRKRIMVGMTANLEIVVYEKADALMVPISAVTSEQGKHFVSRKKAGTPAAVEKVEVTTGYTTQDAVEIVKGVKAGDVLEFAAPAPPAGPSGKNGKK